ncbi:MAG: 2,3-bisphosphoglycerate-independent phosphoglycerate mutase [Acidaminococcales bacterium]|jgi:2,3-bisphosphoglycerate-independent phosphoglycerate mutase|nr:2,3-bisphosphoglycerate-independent phosphoglycerate mutase [Acidaminococcales bacterium]
MDKKKPLLLVILDGFGLRDEREYNAVKLAATPCLDRLFAECPHTCLAASGADVGLPDGQMGNSEVGHLNIGSGRIVYQELTRISKAIKDGSFFKNQVLLSALRQVKEKESALHLIGLLSDGGVHSHIEHLFALLKLAKKEKVKKVYVHALLDGRDTPPQSGLGFVERLEAELKTLGVGETATVAGRYYAMDRDNRWERVEKAYRALALCEGGTAESASIGVKASYAAQLTDEFVLPFLIGGSSFGGIKADDGVIFYNFRADRAREITRALALPDFSAFPRPEGVLPGNYVCMTEYDATFPFPVAFSPENIKETLGEVLAGCGLRQLRLAETEKYAHVTFFFNGGVETPSKGEDRVLVPSPKVATYDLKPEMSAPLVTEKALELIGRDLYDVIIINYANSDMVGHTGVLEAAVRAVETVDKCVGALVGSVVAKGGVACITADHGNAEQMREADGIEPHTAHTTNKVPFILAGGGYKGVKLREGILADIAPTMLQIMGLAKPAQMTGESLIVG